MPVIVGLLIIIIALLPGGAAVLEGLFYGGLICGVVWCVGALLGRLCSFAEIPHDAHKWPQSWGPSFEKKYWSPFGWGRKR